MAGLGLHPGIKAAQLKAANLLHWSGPRKPWLSGGYFQGKWAQYYLHWEPPRKANSLGAYRFAHSRGPSASPARVGKWFGVLLGWLGWIRGGWGGVQPGEGAVVG